MFDLNSVKKDLDKAEDGVWVDFGDGAEILIAQWGNKEHAKYLRNIYKKNKRQLSRDLLDEAEAARLLSGQWHTIVRGWKGITVDGAALEYSPQRVCDLAANPQYKEFFDSLEEIAKDNATYRVEVVEELGNS